MMLPRCSTYLSKPAPPHLTDVNDHRYPGLRHPRPDRVEDRITGGVPAAVGIAGLGAHHENPGAVGQTVLDFGDRVRDVAESQVGGELKIRSW